VLQPKASAQKSGKSILDKGPALSAFSTASNDDSLILLNSAEINVRSAKAQAERKFVNGFGGKRMHLVRFKGPIQAEWHKMLVERDLEIVDYIPNYTYLVYGDSSAINGLQTVSKEVNSPIEWDGIYEDRYRISPDVFASKNQNGIRDLTSDQFQIQLYKDPAANADTMS
jgi:hypothetical protein